MKAVAFTDRYFSTWQKCVPTEIPDSRPDRLAYCNMRGITALKLSNEKVFVAASVGDGTPRTALSVEDKQVVHYVGTREFMVGVTKDGIDALNIVLTLSGFNISKPYHREENNDGQTEFWQVQEWN